MKLTLLRRFVYACIGIVLSVLALELITFSGYLIGQRHVFPYAQYQTDMRKRAGRDSRRRLPGLANAGRVGGAWPEVIHPYLGFVPDPGKDGTTIGDANQVLSRSPDKLIVGVFGGSFAGGLCGYGKAELGKVLQVPGRKVQLLCFGAGGYKQPQQLLALTYILSLGGTFDLVINIDGFNEVTLPVAEGGQGVFPIYPRGWLWRVGNLNDPQALEYLGGLYALDRQQEEWANLFVQYGLHRSTLLSLVWSSRDRLLAARRSQLQQDLAEHKTSLPRSYASTGPRVTFKDQPALYDLLVRVWRDGSLQMKRLCDANGIAYYHFLQPNQYVEGSKPMTDAEAKVAVQSGHLYQQGVVGGYPVLQKYGVELTGAGVAFRDLTRVFDQVQEPLYVDNCCHVNGRGYNLVADAIGAVIQADRAQQAAGATW